MRYILILVLTSLSLTACQSLSESANNSTPTTTTEVATPPPSTQTSYSFTATAEDLPAIDLLRQNATIETQDFGDAGTFITSINGLAGDAGHYWAFYLNGEYAQTGVDQTILNPDDTIEFKYETIDSTNF